MFLYGREVRYNVFGDFECFVFLFWRWSGLIHSKPVRLDFASCSKAKYSWLIKVIFTCQQVDQRANT
ncbi:hypothetical protein CL619_01470 [archaeon]|nr:hypothetical protein [archaeon]|tara:strand:- start:2522 stop:2722 length:201 start_codon:yes stop_codon:yes gene_type:complete